MSKSRSNRKLLDMMSKSRNNRKLPGVMSKSRSRTVFSVIRIVLGILQEKHRGRKQSPDRKSEGRGSSSRKKIILQKIKKNLKAVMQVEKRRTVFLRNRTPLRRMMGRNRAGAQAQGIPKRITAAVILTIGMRKRADTTGVSIRTGSARKNLILNVISRRKMPPLRKTMPLPMAQNRRFRAARS